MQNFDRARQMAEQAFGEKAKATVRLSTTRHLFDGVTAIDFVKDQKTLGRVIEVLTQFEHGNACWL
ncbi:DUF2384 domain-containing protein [Pseudomonas sp. GZD-222]|uniref:DUF2384 domain-containing protein n=1 Tax=Pseudomonas sp. GZD-222 TaxID=3404805 RepID=UPI003BB6093B